MPRKGPTPSSWRSIRIASATCSTVSYSDHWGDADDGRALDQIAQRVKTTRDADFTTSDEHGRLLNSVRSIGTLGGATIDNEENYLIKKLFGGGLGVVSIENQARI